MNKPGIIIVIFITWPITTCFAAASNANDSLLYQIGFEQELNTYRWLGQIYYQQILFNSARFRIIENFGSSLIHLSSLDRKWKDDQQLHLEFQLPLTTQWSFKLATAANQFRDRLSGLISDFNTHWGMAGAQFQSGRNYDFFTAIGYKFDDRQIRRDRGLTHHIQFLADSIAILDYLSRFSLLSKGDNYRRRQNADYELKYQVTRHFQEGAFDSLVVFWNKKRRDNYDQLNISQLTIESFEENNKGFANFLRYGPFANIQLQFRTGLQGRQTSVRRYSQINLDERRSRNDFHSENEIGLLVQHRLADMNVALNYETDDQKNQIPDSARTKKFSKYYYYISPDFISSRLTLLMRISLRLSPVDSLRMYGSISRYRYDTPKTNPDDRDELRWNFALTETHYFAPYFKLITNASVILNHLVYIFGERSANNNWMRIFHLFPQIIYQPSSQFSLAHDLEVYANYVDYDFEFGTTSAELKSYVYRKFSLNQELKAQIARRTQLLMSNKIELEENGKLDWERWTEFLLMNRDTYWFRLSLGFRPVSSFLIAPGFLFSRRNERNQNLMGPSTIPISRNSSTIISFGPILKFSYSPNRKLHLSFEGMRRAIKMDTVQRNYFNNINFELTWYN